MPGPKKLTKRNPNRPWPEAITHDPWDVTITSPTDPGGLPAGAAGGTNIERRIMATPGSKAERDRFVRIHEMLHAKHTPADAHAGMVEGVSAIAWQKAEDARIHRLGGAVVSHLSPIGTDAAEATIRSGLMAAVNGEADLHGLICGLVGNYGTADWHTQQQVLNEMVHDKVPGARYLERMFEAANRAVEMSLRGRPTIDDTNTLAQTLTDLVAPNTTLDPEAAQEDAERRTEAAKEDGVAEDEAEEYGAFSDRYDVEGPDEGTKLPHYVDPKLDREIEWGEMRIIRPPLEHPHSPGLPSEDIMLSAPPAGPMIAPWAMTYEGQGFARIGFDGEGGTVLIDASGSMHLEPDEVLEILKLAPGATVAMYSGDDHTGALVIVAENGKCATAEVIQHENRSAGGGNTVDRPALEWLSDKEGPRLWVSDGMVVPARMESYGSVPMTAIRQCQEVRRKAEILRIGGMTALKMLLRDKARIETYDATDTHGEWTR